MAAPYAVRFSSGSNGEQGPARSAHGGIYCEPHRSRNPFLLLSLTEIPRSEPPAVPSHGLIDGTKKFIDGLLSSYVNLRSVVYPQTTVVYRTNSSAQDDKVVVIAGGAGGYEPSYAGFVGEGLLSAAICGNVFTSPPADSVSLAIRSLIGRKGCLLLVENYLDDKLHFCLAADMARDDGLDIQVVVVGDDYFVPCALDGHRTSSGMVLVSKVAGAAAAQGLSLAEVTIEARRVSGMVRTVGAGLSCCPLPDKIDPFYGIKRGAQVVVLINRLLGVSEVELMVEGKMTVKDLKAKYGFIVKNVYFGSFRRSLTISGHISVLDAMHPILEYLDFPADAPCWPNGFEGIRLRHAVKTIKDNSHKKRNRKRHAKARKDRLDAEEAAAEEGVRRRARNLSNKLRRRQVDKARAAWGRSHIDAVIAAREAAREAAWYPRLGSRMVSLTSPAFVDETRAADALPAEPFPPFPPFPLSKLQRKNAARKARMAAARKARMAAEEESRLKELEDSSEGSCPSSEEEEEEEGIDSSE